MINSAIRSEISQWSSHTTSYFLPHLWSSTVTHRCYSNLTQRQQCHVQTSRKEAGVSLLDGVRVAFYMRKKKVSALEEKPGGDNKSDDELVPKKGGNSTVWNFHGFKPDDDAQGVIIFKQCFGIITATNLYNHPQHLHKILYELQWRTRSHIKKSWLPDKRLLCLGHRWHIWPIDCAPGLMDSTSFWIYRLS